VSPPPVVGAMVVGFPGGDQVDCRRAAARGGFKKRIRRREMSLRELKKQRLEGRVKMGVLRYLQGG